MAVALLAQGGVQNFPSYFFFFSAILWNIWALMLRNAEWRWLGDTAEDIYGNGRCLRKIQIVTDVGEAYFESIGLLL